MSRAQIHTQIDIDASPQRVWTVLTDWPAYMQWNPFVHSLRGELQVGARLEAHIRLGRRLMTFTPRVSRMQEGVAFAWLGHAMLPGVFDGEHSFELEALEGGRTRFIHAERFEGFAVRLLMRFVGEATEAGFHEMNAALKARCEG